MVELSALISIPLLLLPVTILTDAQQLPPSCFISNDTFGVPLSATYECLPHFYCPYVTASDPASIPQVCPSDAACQVSRLFGQPCNPQGKYEPLVCPPKFYCPDPKTKLPCPENNFCPTGSLQPRACYWLSDCPAKSQKQIYYGGLALCLVIDVVIGSMAFIAFLLRRRLLRKQNQVHSSPYKKDVEDKVVKGNAEEGQLSAQSAKEDPMVKSLLQGYQRAFNTESSLPVMNLTFESLGYTLSDGKTILSGVSGTIRAGAITAIMGPSGAGKTTFMNVLMGKVKRTHGNLLINGKELELQAFKRIIGYVPQDDIMLPVMTVRETIKHAASVSLPRSWTNAQVQVYVDAVIGTLGLSHVQHTFIGDESVRGISGGQRKRVNIGIELAAAPLALFADEPTSGLDSTSALKVADTLKKIAALGVTVVAVLHQPRYEIFEQFDDILLIVPGGRTAYLGPQNGVIEYFKTMGYIFREHQNPADVLMDILAGTAKHIVAPLTPEELVEKWNVYAAKKKEAHEKPDKPSSPDADNLKVLRSSRQPASFFKQTWLCHKRSLVQQYRQINSLFLEIGVSLLAGALMGIAVNDAQGELFQGMYRYPYVMLSPAPTVWILPLLGLLINMTVGLAGAPAGVKTFGEEKTVFWREAASGYNRFAYYMGKTISVIYRFAITSLHFTAIFYFLACPLISFERMFALILLAFYCVYGLASIVSTLTRRENASLLAVVVCLFSAVFCGFGPTLKSARGWGVEILWNIAYPRWFTEALMTEETIPFDGVYDIELSQSGFGYTLGRFYLSIGAMLAIGSVFRGITFVLLCLTHRDKQK